MYFMGSLLFSGLRICLTFFSFHLLVGFGSCGLFCWLFLLHWLILFFGFFLWFRRWKIKYSFGLFFDKIQRSYDLIKCVSWILVELFCSSVGLDSINEGLSSLMLTSDHSLLIIGEMWYLSSPLLNMLGDLIELGIINLKFTVVEVSIFYWSTNSLKFIEFLPILFLWSGFTIAVDPVDNLVNFLHKCLLSSFI